MGLFASECARCGSKEHRTGDCPHGLFSSKCASCASTEHATSDCPHGLFSSKCAGCGSEDHATSDCPHGLFSSRCAGCGSSDHATSTCPHGAFSSPSPRCARCGSDGHSTRRCRLDTDDKTTASSGGDSDSTSDSGCVKPLVVLSCIVAVVAAVVWLIANVVVPVAALNLALICTVAALIWRRQRATLAAAALIGGGYMLLDIANGWLSARFVDNVVHTTAWLTGFVYINASALGVSVWLLSRPLVTATSTIAESARRKALAVQGGVVAFILLAVVLPPVVYHVAPLPRPQVTQLQPGEGATRAGGNTRREPSDDPAHAAQAPAEVSSRSRTMRVKDPPDHFVSVRELPQKASREIRRLTPGTVVECSRTVPGELRTFDGVRSSEWCFCADLGGYVFSLLLVPSQSGGSMGRAPIDGVARTDTFVGAWFTVWSPPGFGVTPSLRSLTSNEGYDSAFFRSPDGRVEFYVFAPQWSGEPTDIAIAQNEITVATETKTGPRNHVTWYSVRAADGSYTRSYQDTRAADGSTRSVIGVKYSDQPSYDAYKVHYRRFKESLTQFAD